MSERITFPEQGPENDKPYGEQIEIKPKATPESRDINHGSKEQLADILEKIEKESRSSHEIHGHKAEHKAETEHAHSTGLHIKSHGYGATKKPLKSAQVELSTPERAFSRTIHNKAVERASDVAGATVARPSGLLGGAICSFIVSLGVLLICRFYGYEYNFLIGLFAFVGGFLIGLVIEAFLKLIRR